MNDLYRQSGGESIIVSSLRQKGDLSDTLGSLNLVYDGILNGVTPDLLAVDLRAALTHLSAVVGENISEEVLNNVFSRFCIGK